MQSPARCSGRQSKPRPGSAAVRHRRLSRRADDRRARKPSVSRYWPVSAASISSKPAPPATTRCSRCARRRRRHAPAFTRPVEVHITGSLLTYDVDDPLLGKGEAVKSLSAQFPDLRRTIREGFVRYAFTRFGVPYVVSIQCLDSVRATNRLSCREASHVAEHFLKPAHRRRQALPAPPGYSVDDRRAAGRAVGRFHLSPARRHHPTTVIANRRPAPIAPSIRRSVFRSRRRRPSPTRSRFAPARQGQAYRCDATGVRTGNYGYPWQDNFCETRDLRGQCPGGFGHQGQDIRPTCLHATKAPTAAFRIIRSSWRCATAW